VAEKRQIVELSLQPGMSVARAAQSAGVNANQVFKWRQDYRSGLLLEEGPLAGSPADNAEKSSMDIFAGKSRVGADVYGTEDMD
jgi:transposase-like protein